MICSPTRKELKEIQEQNTHFSKFQIYYNTFHHSFPKNLSLRYIKYLSESSTQILRFTCMSQKIQTSFEIGKEIYEKFKFFHRSIWRVLVSKEVGTSAIKPVLKKNIWKLHLITFENPLYFCHMGGNIRWCRKTMKIKQNETSSNGCKKKHLDIRSAD